MKLQFTIAIVLFSALSVLLNEYFQYIAYEGSVWKSIWAFAIASFLFLLGKVILSIEPEETGGLREQTIGFMFCFAPGAVVYLLFFVVGRVLPRFHGRFKKELML